MNNARPKTDRERAEAFAKRYGLTIHRQHALATNKFSFSHDGPVIADATKYDVLLKRMENYVSSL